MNYKTLRDIGDIQGKRVLVRLDYNVPIKDGVVVDSFRLKKSGPTLKFLREKGAKIIIISHIEGSSDTLKPVYEHLVEKKLPITFCDDCIESGGECVEKLKAGEILLCENLRLYDGEKKNDQDFAKKLAALADYYVNDAFSVSHRAHASVVGIPKFIPGFIGLLFEEEIKELSKCFNPAKPFLFILGGAKFETKLPLVEKFLNIADSIFIGGALANDIFKVKGYEIGTSLVSDTSADLSHFASNPKIMLPSDVTVKTGEIKNPATLKKDESILDAGPKTIEDLKQKILEAKTILWNGPLGNFENGFKQPTLELATLIAQATERGASSVLGGGDTLAAIAELKLDDKFTFVSTGGGAMLDFLANETLPGLKALTK